MAKSIAVRTVASLITLVLILSVGRAATGRYAEQVKQIMNAAEAERKRLGLSNEQASDQYPTPYMQLERVTATAGSTIDIVVKGNFQQGTKFLLDNDHDRVQLVSESLQGVSAPPAQAAGTQAAGAQSVGAQSGGGKAEAQAASIEAEFKKITARMENPNLSMDERMQLATRAAQLAQGMMPAAQPMSAAAMRPPAEQAGGVYRMKLQIPKDALPGELDLVAFAPVSGRSRRATVLLIGGKYQLDATATSPPDSSLNVKDWRVKFTMQIAEAAQSGKVEFFHGNDARPFRVRNLEFSFPRDPQGEWRANLQLTQEDVDKLESADAEKGKLEASLDDPKLAASEREKIQARLARLAQQQEEREKAAERDPECGSTTFRVAQGTVEGVLECPTNARTLNLKGALKPAGQ